MGSELERCYDALIIWLNIIKAWEEAVKRWWVNPFESC